MMMGAWIMFYQPLTILESNSFPNMLDQEALLLHIIFIPQQWARTILQCSLYSPTIAVLISIFIIQSRNKNTVFQAARIIFNASWFLVCFFVFVFQLFNFSLELNQHKMNMSIVKGIRVSEDIPGSIFLHVSIHWQYYCHITLSLKWNLNLFQNMWHGNQLLWKLWSSNKWSYKAVRNSFTPAGYGFEGRIHILDIWMMAKK